MQNGSRDTPSTGDNNNSNPRLNFNPTLICVAQSPASVINPWLKQAFERLAPQFVNHFTHYGLVRNKF